MHNNAALARQWAPSDVVCRSEHVRAILLASRRLLQLPMIKRDRQQAILQLVASHAIASQEELRHLLGERGLQVTQATLSRDLRELGVVRAPTEDGTRYVLPAMLAPEDASPSLEVLLPQLFADVDGVSELLVLHTLPGGAQPIAEGIDAQDWPEIIGTIAGENTILIVCRSAEARTALADRLRNLAGRPSRG